MNRKIKKLTIEDYELILKMNENFRPNFACLENIKKFLNNPLNWFYTYIIDEIIVGFAYGYELNRLDNKGDMLYIHEVGVLAKYQRQGLGFLLITSLKDECQQKGMSRIFLATQKLNIPACKLYEKAGGIKMMDHEYRDVDILYLFMLK